ncbi:DUF3499 domain-containing protein [Tsukamurella sp. 8F]|uniref:DUF3499 domain-containing protein n=1 Tax=unclassified Tsukamurella TaxID=2633480 RepID=UPI0023B8B7B7|nr:MULTISPECIES: DUF3499 domain-containing protein [unclassified Tsukamurella]MDF0530377.1 DUF3499 domain-containing protein [Tsukamurella sp. 8J]MDF0587674.1 DUF3499 domain-containing protein [Tsukamurella sp. 8F]
MNPLRQCCRPGCRNSAVATLTFDYSESTAVLGPLGLTSEPHSWDLCEFHAGRMTAPRGWEMLRNVPAFAAPAAAVGGGLDDDLTALADTVREREQPMGALPRIRPVGAARRPRFEPGPAFTDHPDPVAPPTRGAHSRPDGTPPAAPPGQGGETSSRGPKHAAPTRRGHLRVLPDPVD